MANKSKPSKTPFKARIISKTELASGFIRLHCAHNCAHMIEENKGGYIKLIFSTDKDKVKKRSISIFKSSSSELTLDFVNHGQSGPCASWARNCKVGDEFEFLGPGPAADTDLEGKHYRFIGDRTAFPAIHQQLSRLSDVQFESCEVTLLITSLDERSYFDDFLNKKGFIFSEQKKVDPKEFISSLPEKELCLWAAGERKTIKAIKKQLKDRDQKPQHKYISSYWQAGKDQEAHSFLKKEDALNDD